jgi:hypothetical protein
VIGVHPPAAHQGCEPCHGERASGITEWSRQVCSVCHADRVDHYAPNECVTCHKMPNLGGPDPASPGGGG